MALLMVLLRWFNKLFLLLLFLEEMAIGGGLDHYIKDIYG